MRQKIKCVIEKIIPPGFDRRVEEHIAEITCRNSYVKPAFYRNIETGGEYSWLAGGVGWSCGQMPGYCCIIGVEKPETNAGRIRFRVLDEQESPSVKSVLESCLYLRDRWGYGKYSELFEFWYGDYKRFSPIINAFNSTLIRNPGDTNGLYFATPSAFEMENRFQIYVERIRECLSPDETGQKRLVLRDCQIIRTRIQNMPPEAIDKADVDQFPAIAAVGFAVHSLSEAKPWESQVNNFNHDNFYDYDDAWG